MALQAPGEDHLRAEARGEVLQQCRLCGCALPQAVGVRTLVGFEATLEAEDVEVKVLHLQEHFCRGRAPLWIRRQIVEAICLQQLCNSEEAR